MDFIDFVSRTENTMGENQEPTLCGEGSDHKTRSEDLARFILEENKGSRPPANTNYNSSPNYPNPHDRKEVMMKVIRKFLKSQVVRKLIEGNFILL